MHNSEPGMENRRFRRMTFKRPVQCCLNDLETPKGEFGQDLSEGGIRIRSNEFIPVGQSVSIGIQLVDSGELIRVIGKVMWVRYNPYSECYQLGLEFDPGCTSPRMRISRFITHT